MSVLIYGRPPANLTRGKRLSSGKDKGGIDVAKHREYRVAAGNGSLDELIIAGRLIMRVSVCVSVCAFVGGNEPRANLCCHRKLVQ